MLRNLEFYNQNQARAYPLADTASAADQHGQRLPAGLLVDLQLRWPVSLGRVAFLSAITVNANLVSVSIQAAASATAGSGFAPLAAWALPAGQVLAGRPYPLLTQASGVGGWVVFGPAVHETRYSGRFAGPASGLLLPRLARPYRPLPLSSLGKLHTASPLTGLVRLRGEAPLQVVGAVRHIAGQDRLAAVIRLAPISAPAENQQTGSNLFEQLAGPCGARPESHNCGDPAPIEQINGLDPDCDGNITLELRGCAVVAGVSDGHGAVIDCGLGLADACAAKRLPAADGRLPQEYDNACLEFYSETLPVEPLMAPLMAPLAAETPDQSLSLSVVESFDSAAAWVVQSGHFDYAADDSPAAPNASLVRSYSSEGGGASQLNLATWTGFDWTVLNRRCVCDFKLLAGAAAASHNAALVINYRPAGSWDNRYSYYLVRVDYEQQRLSLQYFDGTYRQELGAFVELGGLCLEKWYRLSVTTAGGAVPTLTAQLTSVDGPALDATLGPVAAPQLAVDSGQLGIAADRAETRFSFFSVSPT